MNGGLGCVNFTRMRSLAVAERLSVCGRVQMEEEQRVEGGEAGLCSGSVERGKALREATLGRELIGERLRRAVLRRGGHDGGGEPMTGAAACVDSRRRQKARAPNARRDPAEIWP